MKFPGDLTDEERQEAFDRLRERAVEALGEERATAIEVSLWKASEAVARLDPLRFSRDDSPAFYLHETAPADHAQDEVR